MPLQGNLRDFSTTQLLNLINLAGKSGKLTFFESKRTGEIENLGDQKRERIVAGNEKAAMAFRSGKLVFATMNGQDGTLVSVLNKAGKLSDEQARIIRERAKNTTDKALALLLINANYVSQNDIVSCIQQHTLDVVYNLMSWNDNPFRLDEDIQADNARIQVPIDLENVIIEGARRIREITELNQHLPNLDMALKFPDNPKEKFKGIHLSVEEWRVVSFVNPKNTIRQIAKANNMSEVEIRRVVYGLEQAGLVELVKPPGMEQAAASDRRRRPPQKPQVQKVTVNRLIDKIRSI